MPIAPNINITQANKYSGFLVAEISLKKRTFPRNPVSVMKVLTIPAFRIPATRFIRPEIKNLYPMKLAERIYLAQVNQKSKIKNQKSIDTSPITSGGHQSHL
ncbi:hypothetical protein [Microcoleus sp. M2_C4]|uniref:hypothetical protein n=1 Tax=Microcoleus sp. M2_C4 TaxID=3055370 RepID=UPI002FD6FB37